MASVSQLLLLISFILATLLFPVNSSSSPKEKRDKLPENFATEALTDIYKMADALIQNGSTQVGGARESSSPSQSSWIPKIFKTMKHAFKYLGRSQHYGMGSPYGQDSGLSSAVMLISFLAISCFLMFLFQPGYGHGKRKRRMLPRTRKFRGSPYAYKPPPQWESFEGVKHYSSSEFHPMIVSHSPALVPVAMPMTISAPTMVTTSESHQVEIPYRTPVVVKRTKTKKERGSKSGKKLQMNSGGSETNKEDDDKLTKEEIMYILKTLDED